MMAYASWSVVFGEQPSAAKWNILGTNDAEFNSRLTKAGMVVQQVDTLVSAGTTGTTIIPRDNTIPQNTEGDQYMTLAITPTSATNKLIIETMSYLSSSANNATIAAALFQDTTANALAADDGFQPAATGAVLVPVYHSMVAGTVASTTFKIRAGAHTAGTTSFNTSGAVTAPIYGATTKSFMRITEVVV